MNLLFKKFSWCWRTSCALTQVIAFQNLSQPAKRINEASLAINNELFSKKKPYEDYYSSAKKNEINMELVLNGYNNLKF